MYTVYESPRRSPRHVRPSIETSNILKPKASPKRKAKPTQSLKTLPSSTNTSATTTRATQKKVRKAKINDENKENCTVGSRPAKMGVLGVNGSTLTGKMARPTTIKRKDMRLPLKELPLNGDFDGVGKTDAGGVEVVSTMVSAQQDQREEQRNSWSLDEGIGIGMDWETDGMIR